MQVFRANGVRGVIDIAAEPEKKKIINIEKEEKKKHPWNKNRSRQSSTPFSDVYCHSKLFMLVISIGSRTVLWHVVEPKMTAFGDWMFRFFEWCGLRPQKISLLRITSNPFGPHIRYPRLVVCYYYYFFPSHNQGTNYTNICSFLCTICVNAVRMVFEKV